MKRNTARLIEELHASRRGPELLAEVLNKVHVVEQLYFIGKGEVDSFWGTMDPHEVALRNLFDDVERISETGKREGLLQQHPDMVRLEGVTPLRRDSAA